MCFVAEARLGSGKDSISLTSKPTGPGSCPGGCHATFVRDVGPNTSLWFVAGEGNDKSEVVV